ncbi:MAG: TonB-dependent receptor [Gammaproteobacteria bacterium]|nr:TonB-dependent receptor [Gammaproteobacteria bacterium]MCZ6854380.1 TonB-dependent receptor [Gammaproteobacteria bacterium]
MIEEIIVTARQQSETLRDVPVTVTVFTEDDLDRYNINTLTDASKLVPNFQINHGGSGNGSNLFLRGVGSSSISAAFDQSVAINIDGVVVNIGRFIHNSYLDMRQLEILKGPQSLYFGKSATAGVVSVTSNDPGDAFEAEVMAGYESEHRQTYTELILSGPVADVFGARLAVGFTEAKELFKNLSPAAENDWRGEESLNARLTLVWEPTEALQARFKFAYSTYENDGANGRSEEFCPEGTVQPTTILQNGIILPGTDDCRLNGNTSINDLLPILATGNPGANGGVPYLDQETFMTSLQLNWDVSEILSLTSITAFTDLDHIEFDVYDYNAGVFGGTHQNGYESLSEELRLASNFAGPLNFLAGFYYQDVAQQFLAYQYAVNIGLVALDPITGRGYDYNKNHFLDTKVVSMFLAGYWDLTDNVELTAGLRYTKEEKDGHITIPYVHLFLQGTFGAPPFIGGLKFDDENVSPELAVNWHVTDDVSLFASYKEGFKSGGIDNSALPTASLNPATNPDFPGFLIYESEEADGFEAGMKASLLAGAMRLNATAFTYTYSDLQTQLFDSAAIQFTTLNASELRTRGVEADVLWATAFEGLTLRGAVALTDAKYTDDFFNTDGQNLNGEDVARNADIAGFVGLTYDWSASSEWRLSFSLDARYSNGYSLMSTLDPYTQASFWTTDAALRFYSADERFEISLIGRNLGNEIYAFSSGNRPGACVGADPANADPQQRCVTDPLNIEQDQVVTTSLGVQYTIQLRVRL